MAVSELTDEQRNLLIEIIPLVYRRSENTIAQTLRKIRNGEDLNDDDKKYIKSWNKAPKGGAYKAAKALTYIVIKHFKERGVKI